MIAEYLERISTLFKSGQATELSYRPALNDLFQSIDPTLTVINEPKQSDGGMPDFMFQRNGVPIGWAEAKDIDKDVIKLKGYSVEQRKRYEAAYPNLIYTNGVDFEFIRNGEPVHFVSIADFLMGLQPVPEKFEELERQLKLFAEQKPISIRSASKLAEMMAAKAAIIKDEIGIALKDDPDYRSGLGGQFKSFKANLLPKLEPDEFADIYAETITYGMFAARFHDDDLSSFSRQEALEKLPASNPFLKGLFEYVAGPGLPKRLTYIVDDLVQVMRASDPQSLFREFGKFTARNDPFIHFYEDFLAAYNPKKRKSRGVWYTPEPVVDFIVRAVDDVLKSEFGLTDGLADTSKVTIDWDTGQNDKKGRPITEKRQVHKVQILDPATGTGTFLAKTVQMVSDRVKTRAPGKWSGYVEQDLLPRLHGFELLMASYAMCHMKLDMQLTESGYKPSSQPPRLSVWLTNALEPAERDVRDLFFLPLAEEARGASEVKRQSPIMCVIGNPPYSGESSNNGEHIMGLMEAYKKEPGGHKKLQEKNSKWINDDYVKFIRLAESLIAQNASGGVLGFITNHSYLDNPTFRGMRWHLLKTFDKVWVIDLHGNTKKKEISPDGTLDKNVFDIQQGVAIIVAVKNDKPHDGLATLYHGEIWGNRKKKTDSLSDDYKNIAFKEISLHKKYHMFYEINHDLLDIYDRGFSTSEIFPFSTMGMITKRDEFTIKFDKAELWNSVTSFAKEHISNLHVKFKLPKDSDWTAENAQKDIISSGPSDHLISKVITAPFDSRYTYYTGTTRGFHARPVLQTMRNFRDGNFALSVIRKMDVVQPWQHSFCVDEKMIHHAVSMKEGNYVQPLYIYADVDDPQSDAFSKHRTLNVDPKLYAKVCKAAGIDPSNQAEPGSDFRVATGDARPSEVKVFDYIYGVLHSPNYRATYAEFLKIDFPRIPYPTSPNVFKHVSEKGEELRRLHLMEEFAIGDTPYPYHGDGTDLVAAGFPKFEDGKVFINSNQYFDAIPQIAWNFFIGGYQPAQKWLKDRRGRNLSWDDIGHYQRIIEILTQTDQIMKEIILPLQALDVTQDM